MSNNSEIIKKADMTLADLSTNGGLLEPEQADSFIRKLQIQPTLLQQARTVRMTSPQRKINKIGFGSRILMPATSGVALDADTSPTNRRSKATTEQITLTTKEVIAEVRLPYDVIEDNIERGNINIAGANAAYNPVAGGFKDTIVNLIAERVAIDLEELALLGDTASGDAYLALTDGWLKTVASNTVDSTGMGVGKGMFKAGIQTLPDQYKRVLSSMRHYLSINNEIEYRDSLADRETGLGDQTIQGRNPVFGFGVPVEGVAQMPTTSGILTNPQNLIWGIQRQISFEVDKDITSRTFIIVVTARVDFQIEEELAAVKYTNIGA